MHVREADQVEGDQSDGKDANASAPDADQPAGSFGDPPSEWGR